MRGRGLTWRIQMMLPMHKMKKASRLCLKSRRLADKMSTERGSVRFILA